MVTTVEKKSVKLLEFGGGGGEVIRAMPEFKRFFILMSSLTWTSVATNASQSINTKSLNNCKNLSQVNEFPWMVSLAKKTRGHICGAALVCTTGVF